MRRNKPQYYDFVLPAGSPVPRLGEEVVREGLYADDAITIQRVVKQRTLEEDGATWVQVQGRRRILYHADVADTAVPSSLPPRVVQRRLLLRAHTYDKLEAVARAEGVTVEQWLEDKIGEAWEQIPGQRGLWGEEE